jgi:ankyrin repeat protein
VLIANGAKADAKDNNGKTALQYAVNSNANEAVAYLKQV